MVSFFLYIVYNNTNGFVRRKKMNTHLKDRAKRIVSTKEFENTGTPVATTSLELLCPYQEQKILRMAVRVDGGEYKIPEELNWLLPMFEHVKAYQENEIEVEHSFCYITVRHGLVDSVTDDEWHVDGFSTRITHIPEQNYIWTNNSGTEFVDLNIDFPKEFNPIFHNVNLFLEDFVIPSEIQQSKENTVYVLDPYILHRRPTETKQKERTFVRISFVPIEINDINNTQNPLIPRNYTKNGVSFRDSLKKYSK